MRSILTVTSAASNRKLTTLQRVCDELKLDTGQYDALLNAKIDEASSDAEAYTGQSFAQEGVSETFWHEANDDLPLYFLLDRIPVKTIASVTVDDSVIDASLYRLDPTRGLLFGLDANGYPLRWMFAKSIVIAYTGGYILPGSTPGTGETALPAGVQGAVVDLVTDFWTARGRNPSVKSETNPGVRTVEYWVGAIGEEGELPPRVQMKLAPFRKPKVA